MISPQFRPLVGGYERAAERLSSAVAATGVRVVVVAERRDRAWAKAERSSGYEVLRLWCVYRPHVHALTSLLSCGAYLLWRGRRFDVWHVHQYGAHAALAVAVGRVLRRPVVLKLTSSGSAGGIAKVVGASGHVRALACWHRRVAACVATSEETAREAVSFGIPAERVYLIPNGVDGSEFRPATSIERVAARRLLGVACARMVLYVGRLSPEKNPLGLLDAWARIPESSRLGALLVYLGDGSEVSHVRDRIKALGLTSSVRLAGLHGDVSRWYQAADFLTLSSLREGLSNSMIEAMASGLPVISTRVSGASVLEQEPASGIVVDIADTVQYARAIDRLLWEDALRVRLGENARRRFEATFSLKLVADRTIQMYDSVLSSANGRAR